MNRLMFSIQRVEWLKPLAGVAIGLAAAALIVFAVSSTWDALGATGSNQVQGRPGETPDATRLQLRNLSDALVAANRTGDPVLAEKVGLQVVSILGMIELQPTAKISGSPMYQCALAARHLIAGSAAIKAGGRWRDEDRFQNAASLCRE